MKIICECCKKRVATIEDECLDFGRYTVFNVCRKCWATASTAGVIQTVFYENAVKMGWVSA